ncbi:tetratricopeptide repeat protein [Chryseobacterium artocarpi]|uniref:tetratricopeptide repeat protein n=1 Tax=Chryseobacterium artocarpi TaxID=1414727 RepID=UPI003F2EF84D
MKLFTKIVSIVLLGCQIGLFGQNISDDSLIRKANQEIYNNPDNAVKIAKKLLQKQKDVNKLVKVYLILSTASIAKRDFDESLKNLLVARELVQKTNSLNIKTSVLIAIAMQYQQMDFYSKSLETLDEAGEYLIQLPDNDPDKYFETARSYALRGMIHKSQLNPEIALQEFLIAARNFEKVKEKETHFNQSIVYYNIGYCYLLLNQLNKAEEAFVKSLEFARVINANSLEAFALKGLSEVYKSKKENQTAINLLVEAQELSKKIGDLTLNEGIYREMAENYLAMGNQHLYQAYNGKFFEASFNREQNELSSINHAIDVHNKEMLKKTKEITDHYNILIGVVVVIGLSIMSTLLYITLKMKKKNRQYQDEIHNLIRS